MEHRHHQPRTIDVDPDGVYRHEAGWPPVSDPPGGRARSRLRVFALVAIPALLLSLGFTFLRPPVYQTGAVLMVTPAPGGAEDDVATSNRDFALARQGLMSRRVLDRVMERLPRNTDGTSLIPASVGELLGMISIVPEESGSLLSVRATGPERDFLATLVNTWVDVFVEAQSEEERATGLVDDRALRGELDELQRMVTLKREELEAFRRQHDIVSMERDENRALVELKGLTAALNTAREEEVAARARVAAMEAALARGDSVLPPGEQRTLEALERRATELREQIKSFEQKYTGLYMRLDPNIRAVHDQLELVETEIREKQEQGTAAALSEVRQEFATARRKVSRLEANLSAHERATTDFTARFTEQSALEEELDQLEALYRERKEQLVRREAVRDHGRPRLRVLEPAFEPTDPVSPLYMRDAAISVGGSLGLGVLALLVLELLTRPAGTAGGWRTGTTVVIAGQQGTHAAPLGAPGVEGELPPPSETAGFPREMSRVELDALLASATEFSNRLLLGLLLSGVRGHEASSLRWADLDLEGCRVQVPGPRPREVPLAPALASSLAPGVPAVGDEEIPLFPGTDGTPMSVGDLDATVTYMAHDAGISYPSEVSCEVLFHSYVAHLVRQGARLSDLEHAVGPLAPAVLAGYGELSPPGPGMPLQDVERILPSLQGAHGPAT